MTLIGINTNHSTKVEGEFEVPVDWAGEAAGLQVREVAGEGPRRWGEGFGKEMRRGGAGGARLPLLLAPGQRGAPPMGRAEAGREVAGGEGGISCAVLGKSRGGGGCARRPRSFCLLLGGEEAAGEERRRWGQRPEVGTAGQTWRAAEP
jgi:hypothetical protein